MFKHGLLILKVALQLSLQIIVVVLVALGHRVTRLTVEELVHLGPRLVLSALLQR